MSLITISKPTKDQIVHGVERVGLVFVTVSVGAWLASPDPFSKTALWGACLAGATAVWQLATSLTTSI